ncbi:SDR family NAD(P)-dependent oxidoreductase [Gilvimarinus algae]|uniref:SDR family NAD(P)-dependent oxidoreductase n=1 Tax=Gilvimarinus algae TaxID=3058037 RepID=A0ABT8TEG6_9GAMM|nr:SDR family NAD(P)-dependent oxidoreductase [Gilvimarinus sp. SDUM040014]MDO3382501.1 SDR family NAD(P)-dependent oxidoreductase [Gilvimarinus sp. SDUM040014]
MSREPLAGRRALITGASKGLGLAVTEALLEAGCEVIGLARNVDELKPLEQSSAGRLHAISVDITDRAAIKDVMASCQGVDTLILNAGTCEYIEPGGFDAAAFARVQAVNLQGNANLLEAAIPALRQTGRGGHIIGVSSLVTELPLPRSEAYGASKAGFDYLMASLRTDLYHLGIDVTVVKPGFIRTPLTDKNDFDMPFLMEPQQAAQHLLKAIAQRRYVYRFPWQLALPMRILRLLPTPILTRILQKMVRS